MGHPPPGAAGGAVRGADLRRHRLLHPPAHQSEPGHRLSHRRHLHLQPGAAPSEIENQILQKIEGAVAGIGNVRNISSTASEGSAETFIEFQIGTPIDRAVTDMRDAVSKVRSDLPQGIQEPLVQRVQVASGPIAYFAVSTTQMSEQELSWFVDNALTKRLLAVPGVGQV